MEYTPTVHEVQDLIEDFAQDFGVTLPFEDAERMLISHEELCLLFREIFGRRTDPSASRP